MRFTKGHKAETRTRIVETASALFRKDGIESVSVPALMKEAGLTHGGFYAHFPSKDALVAEALASALRNTTNRFGAAAENAPAPKIAAVIDAYLSEAHRDHPDEGCAVAALGVETARAGAPEARQALADGMRGMADMVAETLGDANDAARRDDATFLLASMVGALVVARVLKDEPALSGHVLDVCRDRIKHAAAER